MNTRGMWECRSCGRLVLSDRLPDECECPGDGCGHNTWETWGRVPDLDATAGPVREGPEQVFLGTVLTHGAAFRLYGPGNGLAPLMEAVQKSGPGQLLLNAAYRVERVP